VAAMTGLFQSESRRADARTETPRPFRPTTVDATSWNNCMNGNVSTAKPCCRVRSVIFSIDVNWGAGRNDRAGKMFAWKTKEPMAEPLKLEAHNSAITTLRYNLANTRLASFDASATWRSGTPGNWGFLPFQHPAARHDGTSGAYARTASPGSSADRKGQVIFGPGDRRPGGEWFSISQITGSVPVRCEFAVIEIPPNKIVSRI